MTVALAAVVVVVAVGLSPQLFAVAQDQEFAQVAGLNVRFYNLLVAVMAAVTVTVAMRTVGLLLVSALMVVPVATAQQVDPRLPRPPCCSSMGLGTLASLGGVAVSAYVDAPPARRSCCWRWRLRGRLPGRRAGCAAGSGSRTPFKSPHARTATRVADRPHRRTRGPRRTSTAPPAGTRPCRTTTTSTTSTTATGTPPTEGHYDEH